MEATEVVTPDESAPVETAAAVPTGAADDVTEPAAVTDPEDKPLGEGGQKALSAEREAHSELKREFAAFRETAVSKVDHDAVATERDALKSELDTLRAAEHTRNATEAIKAAAVAAGARKPGLIARLADLGAFDADKGNAEELVRAVKDDPEYADLFGPVAQPGLGTQDGPNIADLKRPYFTKKQVDDMDTAQYAANREHIFASMKTW
ncbi:hypothetical protein [uncultured Friedmanniella sp.]|uniref:hypothetical protein n=1 Tax=uncultured Friedmanniella sp. TaxID=335381 RepID=UPI0035C9876E